MRGTRLLLAAVVLVPGSAAADQIELPTPDAAQLASTALLRQLPSFRPDRLLPSDVPGPVVNDEQVDVGLAGDGTVHQVLLAQRLRLTGVGDYAVRERGPARSATSLTSDPAPVTRRGAVVWQGFSPGSRSLGAELVLDPLIEVVHLPLSIAVTFTGSDGRPRPLLPGAGVPGPGTVTLTVRNDTEQPQQLPTAADASPAELAPVLDRALATARHPSAARLPNTDVGLPKTLAVTGGAREQASQAVPFLVRGTLRLVGTTGQVTGPATKALPDGASFAGVLGGVDGVPQVSFTVATKGTGSLGLDLSAFAALDPRLLAPPRDLSSWRAWAASRPPLAERRAALDLVVQVAATGARAASYSPYLGAGLSGSGSTTFHYAFAPAERAVVVRAPLHPKWGAIGVGVLVLLLLTTGAGLVWRRL